ncbi:MAG TPA: hypothetical protein GX524_04245 [Firmicutes bacterium]|nr:hypothetical protein [Bacillota bacterium]
MRLTKRRYEFLEALTDLVNKKGAPVHYGDVAERLSVSKWTAYDMMRELAEDGLVETSYSVNRIGLPGRSLVLFKPTKQGFNLVDSRRPDNSLHEQSAQKEDEWHRITGDMLSKISMSFNNEFEQPFDFSKDKYKSSPALYCAALLSFLLVEAKKKGLDLVALRGILEIGSQNGMTLSLFTGLLLGGLLVQGARKLLPDFESLIHSFSRQVEHLEDSSKDRLLEFAQEVVNHEMLT